MRPRFLAALLGGLLGGTLPAAVSCAQAPTPSGPALPVEPRGVPTPSARDAATPFSSPPVAARAGSPHERRPSAPSTVVTPASTTGRLAPGAATPSPPVARPDKPSALGAAQDLGSLRARVAQLSTTTPRVSDSVLTSITHLLDVAERIASKFPTQAAEWKARAASHLAAAEHGEDLYPAQRGQIVSRGYRSPISQRVQGYTVYVPPDYTPEKRYPLMIVLHGGSSNGNLFLGVVLGNNMDWKTYDAHLWDRYEPRWSPNFIVAAPDGYGQVLWRWMGEQDVLDVIDDIAKNYQVDADRVVLSGLSNGGVGAYAIGSRHAWRFAAVQAMAGAPSWLQYAGEGSVAPIEARLMRPWSALDLAENWHGTDFRYYHGNVDPGPMKPAYVRALDQVVQARAIPHTGKWFEAGHDLLYIVHRHGKVYGELERVQRKPKPAEVHLVTGDYRAARQHWLELTRFASYPDLARLVAKVTDARIDVSTSNAVAFAIHLQDVPSSGPRLALYVDGVRVYDGPREKLGTRIDVVKRSSWELGTPQDVGLVKRPGLSGPLTDAYYDRMVHVYGTQRAENTAQLRQLAEKGARGYPLWLWSVEQEVVADSAVTPELERSAHLVLYGTPGDNAVLDRIAPKLPIQVDASSVKLGAASYAQKGVGTRFIYPNPEAQGRYVIAFSAPTLAGVRLGLNLPDFVPDYVVYDAQSASARPRLVPGKQKPVRGFFDARWRLEGGAAP
jgi:poly(3-hydroxybutyrate) depolymerase